MNGLRPVAEIQFAKHRNGSTGLIKLAFVDKYARFENLEPESDFAAAGGHWAQDY